MIFKALPYSYSKGEILEAGQLNHDFALNRFLTFATVERFSDGILGGMITRLGGGGLHLTPGAFKLNGNAHWLENELAIDLPPVNATRMLLLKPTPGPGEFLLEWGAENDPGLCLCRLKITSQTILKDSWLLTEGARTDLIQWERHLKGSDYIQLEYAMAASLGEKPTLLPAIQHALARICQRTELQIWLLNGLLPLLDYYGQTSWTEALACLMRDAGKEKPEKPREREERNLAG